MADLEPNEATHLKENEQEEEEEKIVVREGSVDLDDLYKNELWYLSSTDIGNYHEFFVDADLNKDGFISGYEANEYFKEAILNRKQLREIWSLCDYKHNGRIPEAMFYVMFHIFYQVSKSEGAIPIPQRLPQCLQYDVVEKLRLISKLKSSKNDDKQHAQALHDIEEFKAEQEKKRNEMRTFVHHPAPRAQPLSKEQIKENKRRHLANVYDLNKRQWSFNDILGHKRGPFDINELVECWRNNGLTHSTTVWKTNERYRNQTFSHHAELYAYIRLFGEYRWFYRRDSTGVEHGPYHSYQMKRYVESGTVNRETEIRRVPPFVGDRANDFKLCGQIDVYDEWSKTITKIDHKNEGWLIQDTATMFLHNLCYYFFVVCIWFDGRTYDDDRLWILGTIAIGICIFESVLISLGQFELKEGFIPFTNLLMPIAVIQLILEWIVNVPMVIIEVYYLYWIKWNKETFDDKINTAVYVSFGAYVLHNFYKVGVIQFHHYDEFRDRSNPSEDKKVKRRWKCCNVGHALSWAFAIPVVFIVFGAMYLKNDENDFVLSLVLLIIGCVACCCLACAGAIYTALSAF